MSLRLDAPLFSKLRRLAIERANVALCQYVRRRFPIALSQVGEVELLRFITAEREVARQFGVEREDCVATFIDMAAMYGVDFHAQPWAHGVLNSPLHGPDKMALLRQRVAIHGVTFGCDD